MPHHQPAREPSRGMRISCSQRWEDMAVVDRGRFCSSCQKPVIDFSGWSREELIAWFKREPETCGMFEKHQVDPRFIPVEQVGRAARRGLFAMIAASGLVTAQAQTPAEPTVLEHSLRKAGQPATSAERPRSYAVNPKLTWEECPAIPEREPRKRKVRVYVSRSFPFVHFSKRRFRTLGCPSF